MRIQPALIAFFAFTVALRSLAQPLLPDASFVRPTFEQPVYNDAGQNWAVAHPDGGALVSTNVEYIDGKKASQLFKIRSDGTVDPSFATAPFPTGTFTSGPHVVYIYADGRSLVHDGRNSLLRLLANGQRDPAYSPVSVSGADLRLWPLQDGRFLAAFERRLVEMSAEGRPTYAIALDGTPYDVIEQTDGKILIAGSYAWPGSMTRSNLIRLNRDGTLDQTFDTRFALPSDLPALALTLAENGDILAATRTGLRRLFPNGSLNNLPAGGDIPTQFFAGSIFRLSPRGPLYFMSSVRSGSESVSACRRITTEGTVDPNFVMSGEFLQVVYRYLSSWNETTFYYVGSVTLDRVHRRLMVSRADARGNFDPNFGPRFSNQPYHGWTLHQQPDGNYLIAGWYDHVNGTLINTRMPNCVRLNIDGSLDRGFQPPFSTLTGSNLFGTDPVGIQPDGRVIARAEGGLIRLATNGAKDPNFPLIPALRAAVGADGSIVVLDPDYRLARYSREGVRDPAFNSNRVTFFDHLSIAPDGKIYLAATVRLLANGAPDTGWSMQNQIYPNARNSYALLANGSVLIFWEMPGGRQVRLYDPTGRRASDLWIDGTLTALGRAAADIVAANGGGPLRILIAPEPHVPGGTILVRGDEVTIMPDSYESADPELPLITRFRVNRAMPSTLTPRIYRQPRSVVVDQGNFVHLTVEFYGQLDVTYQWYKNGVPFREPQTTIGVGVGGMSISNFQASDAGDYHVEVRNAVGVTRSETATLALSVAPQILQRPQTTLTVAPGQTLALTLNLAGSEMEVRWLRNQVTVSSEYPVKPGVHTILLPITAAAGGNYRATVTNTLGVVETQDIVITVNANATPSRLNNISVRTSAGTETGSVIVGFAVNGERGAGLPVLIRGIGPALAGFGVTDFMRDPRITLHSGSTLVMENDNWGGAEPVRTAASRLGAFALVDVQSRDAALLSTLQPGAYTVQIDDAQAGSGTVLGEIYDAATTTVTTRLVNLSSRAFVTANDGPLIAGFVISGATAKTVLLRGIGPGLTPLGVTNALPRAELALFDSAGRKLAESTTMPANLAVITPLVGAFAVSGQPDQNAALAITLPPGAYTAQLRGPAASSGSALIEVYEVP